MIKSICLTTFFLKPNQYKRGSMTNREKVKDLINAIRQEGSRHADKLEDAINAMVKDIFDETAAEISQAIRVAKEMAYEDGYQAAKQEYT